MAGATPSWIAVQVVTPADFSEADLEMVEAPVMEEVLAVGAAVAIDAST